MSKRVEEKAMDAWAIYEYREHPKGLYHTCFVDGYKEGYEQAEKDTIERIRKQVKQWMPKKDWDEHTDGERLAFNSVLHLLEEMEDGL